MHLGSTIMKLIITIRGGLFSAVDLRDGATAREGNRFRSK